MYIQATVAGTIGGGIGFNAGDVLKIPHEFYQPASMTRWALRSVQRSNPRL